MAVLPLKKLTILPEKSSKRRILLGVFCTSVLTAILITIFEVTKQWIHPIITIWQSHLVTIMFSTTVAAMVSYFILTQQSLHEDRLRLAIESRQLGTFDFWPLTGKTVLSDITKLHFGLHPEATLDYGAFLAGLHSDDQERVAQFARNALQPERGGEYRTECRTIGIEDGKERWLALGVHVYLSAGGQPVRVIGTTLDITEQKLAEKELEESERKFRTLFEQATVGVAEIDAMSGRFLTVNKRYCDIVGLSLEEMLSTDFQSITYPDDLQADLDYMKLLIAGEITEFSAEKRYIKKDGGIVWVNLTVYTAWLPGEYPTRHIAIVEDITGRKKAEAELQEYRVHLEDLVSERTGELKAANEKLKELDKLKSMFIASMSHELRTPLNSIIGFTGMTLQGLSGELNDEQKDNLSRAYQSANHLLSLITDVIDISKIEAGRIESYPEVVSLDNIIDEAIGAVRPQLKDKGLELAVEVPGDVQLNTDRKRLLQCLLNLLSNAVKFTESGTITVGAREADGQVMLSVSDTGIGIAEKDQPKVFEAFERFETHLRVKAGGTGLGLYLTRKLARDILRGDVLFQSKEGQGSTFTLRVPKDLRQNPDIADIPDKTGDIG